MEHGYWGPEFDDAAIAAALVAGRPERFAPPAAASGAWDDEAALDAWTAAQIAAGRVVGWFQGRMEWGARALGNRSIVADPRRADMRDIINTRIKFRERFRPFAPSVPRGGARRLLRRRRPRSVHAAGLSGPAGQARRRAGDHARRRLGPAADGQPRSNRRYWNLIKAFERITGVPMLLNTSFNENEPIVLTPEEALDCFLRTHMDVLVMGRHVVERPLVD